MSPAEKRIFSMTKEQVKKLRVKSKIRWVNRSKIVLDSFDARLTVNPSAGLMHRWLTPTATNEETPPSDNVTD